MTRRGRGRRAASPTIVTRIELGLRKYNSEFYKAYVDSKAFDQIVTDKEKRLNRARNYTEWKRCFKILCQQIGFSELFNRTDIELPTMENLATTSLLNEDQNNLALKHTAQRGRNSLLIDYINKTVELHIQTKLEGIEFVSQAITVLEAKCTSTGADITIEKYSKVIHYSLDELKSFSAFLVEFDKRVKDFNDLRGGFTIGENEKVLIFLRALGSRFRNQINTTSQINKLAGYRSAPTNLTFDQVSNIAENAQNSVSTEPEPILENSRSFAAGFKVGQKRTFSQRDRSGEPPLGTLIGPDYIDC